MSEARIVARNLTKTYHVLERDAGLSASLRSLMHRTYRKVAAVREASFTLEAGEMVGFIGPNGAGKTTTLKMLAGLLHPTSGTAAVLGFTPWHRQPDYLRQISMVLGNKSQLVWDIPPLDTYRVLAEIYRVPPDEFKRILSELVDLLAMAELLKRPVRNLSLGERMKCELVAGLLHHPRVLFLDEPTLGLDVSMQAQLRLFLAEYNARKDVTVILTSHYMADVVALCPRVILIHQGTLLYDGALTELAQRLAPFKLIRVSLDEEPAAPAPDLSLPRGAQILERSPKRLTLRVGRSDAPALTAQLLQTLPLVDLSIEDPPVEAVIDQIYREGEL